MRLTNSMVTRSTLFDLNRSLGRLQQSQQRLSTGKSITRVSDDPTNAMTAVGLRGELRRAEQRSRTADVTATWLKLADDSLVRGLEVMNRATELAIGAVNGGILDANGRNAIGTELRSIREEMLAIANTDVGGRSIFNGTARGAAYDAAGVYQGNAAAVNREVAPGLVVQANLTGETVFGAQTDGAGNPVDDLFAVLEGLAVAVESDDLAGITAGQVALQAGIDRLSAATAEIGSRASRLESIQERAKVDEYDLRERLSTIEDVDLAEALIDMQTNENAYTAALQAASRVMPPSLLDYLR